MGGSLARLHSNYWQLLLHPLYFIALITKYQTSYKDAPWTFLILCIGWGVEVLGNRYIPNNFSPLHLAPFFSAFAYTMASTIWSNWKNRPIIITLAPALTASVSSSLGFLGFTYILQGFGGPTAVHDVQTFFDNSVLLVLGIEFSLLFYSPKTTF